jgi:hypothetical protein
VAALVLLVSNAEAQGPGIRAHFADEPDDALVHKLEIPDGESSYEYRQVPELGGVVVQGRGAAAGSPVKFDLTFRLRHAKHDARYERLTYRAAEWYGSTFWSGPDWTRVGKDWHHPGENTPSVRSFYAPHTGRAKVSGRVHKLHLDGDGVTVSIHLNDAELWRTEIDGKDEQGVDPNLTVDLTQGDRLRFRVHKRGRIFCDTTHWDPIITYENGDQFRASASFDAKRQGVGHWYYEQWVAKQPDPPVPTVYAFDRSLAQRTFAMTAGTSATFSSPATLPYIVISDGTDSSGVLLAAETSSSWTWKVAMTEEGSLDLRFETPRPSAAESAAETQWFIAPFEGPWISSFAVLKRLRMPGLLQAYHNAVAGLKHAPEVDLLLMAQAEWHEDDQLADDEQRYRDALEEQLRRTTSLLETTTDNRLALAVTKIAWAVAQSDQATAEELNTLYLRLRLLKRDLLLDHPLLDFDQILICKRKPPGYSHLVGQYYGWRQRPGGGIFVLEKPGISLECRDVLQDQLPPGNVLEPRLSYDGQRIVFSYVVCPEPQLAPEQLAVNEQGSADGYFHIYEINTDGSQLRQLTDGAYDDMMPVYLPDGGIAFTSTRRRSYSRCFGPQFSKRWDSYTLHRMDRDGGHLRILSPNDVSEWFPAVAHGGHLLFARWDYIDRDAVTHQNLWSMRPDGTNPAAVWGNATPKPHCTFQAKAVPGSQKIAFIASAHHAITAGPVCLVDPTVDANAQEAITRITPGSFPEAESRQIPEYYCSPWPLSEDLFLVSYSRDRLRFEGEHQRDPNPDNALGIYLLDAAGNRELLYRDPRISSTNATPLVPRPKPPVLTDLVAESDESLGEMILTDVYQGLGDVSRGTIRQLRIVQIFPKTTPLANNPRIGLAGEENGRAILGTVPVEPDGSARFLLPAHKPVLFQALDENGFAYQTMRSTTYVQPGERTACVGCHEHRMSSPLADFNVPLAVRRPPSRIQPGEFGGRPFSYMEVVQPVLDRHCIRCHNAEKFDGGVDLTGAPESGFSKSYWSLCGKDADWRKRVGNLEATYQDLVPRYWMRNQIQQTPPGGKIGALGSRLMAMLRDGHEDVQMDAADLRRLALWIDMNAIFYGVYDADEQAKQFRGETVAMPDIQ